MKISVKDTHGFSLVEVLVFLTVVSVFFTFAASVSTYMIRASKINQHKIIATRYAEELVEWLRTERDISWSDFSSHAANNDSTKLCFSTLSWASTCDPIDELFTRSAFLEGVTTAGSVHQINVRVVVQWDEANNTHTVPVRTVFSIWE